MIRAAVLHRLGLVWLGFALGSAARAEEWTTHLATWNGANLAWVLPDALSNTPDPVRQNIMRRLLPPGAELIGCRLGDKATEFAMLTAVKPPRAGRYTRAGFFQEREALKVALADPEKVRQATELLAQLVREAKTRSALVPDARLDQSVLVGAIDESDSHYSVLQLFALTLGEGAGQRKLVGIGSSTLLFLRGKIVTLSIGRPYEGIESREAVEDITREVVRRTIEANTP